MTKRKKWIIVVVCISIAMLLVLPSPVSAATWKGKGGTSTLDYMSSARAFSWSVKPATKRKYSFSGSITIKSANKKVKYGTMYIDGSGKGRVSGVKYIPKSIKKKLKAGKTYYAAYSGYCIDSANYTFYIPSGIGISFAYN